jgi:hypothetical protein
MVFSLSAFGNLNLFRISSFEFRTTTSCQPSEHSWQKPGRNTVLGGKKLATMPRFWALACLGFGRGAVVTKSQESLMFHSLGFETTTIGRGTGFALRTPMTSGISRAEKQERAL